MRQRNRRNRAGARVLCTAVLAAGAAFAHDEPISGQTVYVPIYSEVPYGDRTGMLLVRASVVVRNVDPKRSLTIESVAYHDSEGKQIAEYAETPVRLAPLASRSFDVKETDTAGGPTPSMIVRWQAEQDVNPPLIEGRMISTFENLGLSFRTEGRVLTLPRPSR